MKEYVDPNAELVEFDSKNVIATSGCNCYFDRWNNSSTDLNSGCEGESDDASEFLMNA